MTGARAAVLVRHDRPLEIRAVDVAAPGPDEVAVTITHAGVNPVDRYVAEGRLAPDAALPRTLGSEAAGTLDDASVVLVSGEGLGAVRDGVWANEVVVPAACITPVPAGIDPAVVASMGVAGLTAWSAVALRAAVTSQDRVLVLGAGGGVGLGCVSLAAARGATVWGQVGTASKGPAVSSAGAARVLTGDADAIGGLEPTVVIDPLGGAFTPAALAALQPGGRYVVFGTSAGAQVTLDWQQVYRKNLTIHGQGNMVYTSEERRRHLGDALAAAADGELRLPIDRLVPLDQVNDALAALANREVTGNLVLTM